MNKDAGLCGRTEHDGRIGYAAGAFDLFHVGHLNLLRRAKNHCDYLIAGVVSDEMIKLHKGITPVIPLEERLEIVRSIRFVDQAVAEKVADKFDIWQELRFDVLFKGDDWRGTEKGRHLEEEFAAVGVKVVYFPYSPATSSTVLRKALVNIDHLAHENHLASSHLALPVLDPALRLERREALFSEKWHES